MTSAPPAPGPDPRQLLTETLRDPFADYPSTHVRNWFSFVAREFPFWSLQPHAYAAFGGSDLPTTHPLPLIIESILRDEVVDPGGQSLEALPAELDRRRYGFLRSSFPAQWGFRDPERRVELLPGYTQFLPTAADLSFLEEDSEHTVGGYTSPYDVIGRELVAYVEAREQAGSGTPERAQAQEALDGFLRRLGVKLARGRPPAGAPDHVLEALVVEGRTLFEQLLWGLLPFDVSDEAVRVLKAQRVPQADMELWASRLALPFLSLPEILALKEQSEEAAQWKRGDGSRPTARIFVIWTLAHRLGIQATTLARTVLNTEDAEYFQDEVNPIDTFRDPASRNTPH